MQVFGKLDKSKVFNRIFQPSGKGNMPSPFMPLQNNRSKIKLSNRLFVLLYRESGINWKWLVLALLS